MYTKTGLVFGFSRPRQNASGWRMARWPGGKKQILVACPTCRADGQLSPDRKLRGSYSGKIVFGFYPNTILRWV